MRVSRSIKSILRSYLNIGPGNSFTGFLHRVGVEVDVPSWMSELLERTRVYYREVMDGLLSVPGKGPLVR